MKESILAAIAIGTLIVVIRAALRKYLDTEKITYWLRPKKDCKHCCIVCEYYEICRGMERGKE